MNTIVGIVIGCINIGLWIFFFIRFKKQFSPAKILKDIKVEVDKLIIEISRETDRDITLIDARIKGLKALIEDANRYTTLAAGELDKRSRENSILTALRQPELQNAVQKNIVPDPLLSALAEASADEIVISGAAAASKPKSAVSVQESPGPLFPEEKIVPVIVKAAEQITVKKDIRSRVLELAAEGFVPEHIAAVLSMSITEVQLIMDMYGSL